MPLDYSELRFYSLSGFSEMMLADMLTTEEVSFNVIQAQINNATIQMAMIKRKV